MLMLVKPSVTVPLTSAFPPWSNHRVKRRSVSCNELPAESAMDLKKPRMAGMTWSTMFLVSPLGGCGSAPEARALTISKFASAQPCHALYHLGLYFVAAE